MINCTHCGEPFKTMDKNFSEGQIIECFRCEGITPYQKTREVREDDQTEQKSIRTQGNKIKKFYLGRMF